MGILVALASTYSAQDWPAAKSARNECISWKVHDEGQRWVICSHTNTWS